MKRETLISIPQPCPENWNAMTPLYKGRFCASCAKTAVDFSNMTDDTKQQYTDKIIVH